MESPVAPGTRQAGFLAGSRRSGRVRASIALALFSVLLLPTESSRRESGHDARRGPSGAHGAFQLWSASRACPGEDIPDDARTRAYEYSRALPRRFPAKTAGGRGGRLARRPPRRGLPPDEPEHRLLRERRRPLLHANAPNPFSDRTSIRFELAHEGPVDLRVYDLRGALVRAQVAGERAPGVHRVERDGRDGRGHRVAPGSCFCRLAAEGTSATRRMLRVEQGRPGARAAPARRPRR